MGVLKFVFDDLGVFMSKILGRKLICCCYSRFGGFHFQKSLVLISRARKGLDLLFFFMVFSKVFMAVEISLLCISKVTLMTVKRGG